MIDDSYKDQKKDRKSDQELSNIIKIWKTIIEVQKHFNDIAIRLRSIAITLFTFFIAAMGFSVKEGVYIIICNLSIPLGTFIGLLGIIPIWGFYFMDRHWYHRFLKAAVKKGEEIEKNNITYFPEINLADAIKKESPYKFLGRYELHSDGKLILFYALLAIFLSIASIGLYFAKF